MKENGENQRWQTIWDCIRKVTGISSLSRDTAVVSLASNVLLSMVAPSSKALAIPDPLDKGLTSVVALFDVMEVEDLGVPADRESAKSTEMLLT